MKKKIVIRRVIRCPHCLLETELSIYHGDVICSACDRIFVATANTFIAVNKSNYIEVVKRLNISDEEKNYLNRFYRRNTRTNDLCDFTITDKINLS